MQFNIKNRMTKDNSCAPQVQLKPFKILQFQCAQHFSTPKMS